MRLLVSPVALPGAGGLGNQGIIKIGSGGCVVVGDAALVELPGRAWTRTDASRWPTLAAEESATFRVGDQYRLGGTLVEKDADYVQPYLSDDVRACGSRRYLLVFGG